MKKTLMGLPLIFWLGLACADLPGPLVDASWMEQNNCREGLVVLDIRSMKIDGQAQAEYEKVHIPCALHSDYVKAGWRVKAGDVPGMLPAMDKLERLIGGLGIDNETDVVVAHLGKDSKSTASATRLYWTFKMAGHDKVAILNGGTLGYSSDKSRPMETGVVSSQPKTFRAQPRPEPLANRDDLTDAASQGMALVDYRRADEFMGITRNAKTKQAGTLQGARNLPIEWLTKDNGGEIRSPASLRQLMGAAEIDATAPQIAFCNTAHNASLGWFVASEMLGNPRVRVYDGSMAEWSRVDHLPIERKVTASD